MAQFQVDVYSSVRHRFFVEAKTEKEATEKARAEIENSSDQELASYCKDWDIEDVWADKINNEGQDRESYSDEQDRENYTA